MGFLRYINYILLTFLLAFFAPVTFFDKIQYAYSAILFLYAFTIAFMVNRTMERKRQLRESVSIELSRLRRVHHIAEGMGTAKWRHELDDALTRYQLTVSQDITAYNESQEAYREMSHMIYQYKPRNRHEEILLEELLDTTRDLALGRQRIRAGLKGWLEPYHWFVMTIYVVLLVLSLFIASEVEFFARLVMAFAIFSIFLSIDLLWYSNRMDRHALERFQHKYQVNIPDKQEPNQKG